MNQLKDKKLKFYPKKHTYKYGQQPLRSVSEWLGSFTPPFKKFDAKAVSKALSFHHFKKTGTKKSPKNFRDEWKAITEEGTAVHAEIEDYIKMDFGPLNLVAPRLPRAKQGIQQYNLLKSRYDPTNIQVETRIYSEEMGLAGTMDLLFMTPQGAVIIDWKTNRKLRGKVPATGSVFDVDGDNLSKYTLQLNTYAYLLDKYYGIPILAIKLVHLEETDATVLDIPYMPSMVFELFTAGKQC